MAFPFYSTGRLADFNTAFGLDDRIGNERVANEQGFLGGLARDYAAQQMNNARVGAQERIAGEAARTSRFNTTQLAQSEAARQALQGQLAADQLTYNREALKEQSKQHAAALRNQLEYGELVGKYGGFNRNPKLAELDYQRKIEDKQLQEMLPATLDQLNTDVENSVLNSFDADTGFSFKYGFWPRSVWKQDRDIGREALGWVSRKQEDVAKMGHLDRNRLNAIKDFQKVARSDALARFQSSNPDAARLMRFIEVGEDGRFRQKIDATTPATPETPATPTTPTGPTLNGTRRTYGTPAINPPSGSTNPPATSYFNNPANNFDFSPLGLDASMPVSEDFPATAPAYKGPITTDTAGNMIPPMTAIPSMPAPEPQTAPSYLERLFFSDGYFSPEQEAALIPRDPAYPLEENIRARRVLSNPGVRGQSPYELRGQEGARAARQYQLSDEANARLAAPPNVRVGSAEASNAQWRNLYGPGYEPTLYDDYTGEVMSAPRPTTLAPARAPLGEVAGFPMGLPTVVEPYVPNLPSPVPVAGQPTFFQTVNDEILPYDNTAPRAAIPYPGYQEPVQLVDVPTPALRRPYTGVTPDMIRMRTPIAPLNRRSAIVGSPRGLSQRRVLMRR